MYLSRDAWYTYVVPDIGTGGFGEMYRRVFMQLGLSIFLPLVRLAALSLGQWRDGQDHPRLLGKVFATYSPSQHRSYSQSGKSPR